NTADRSCFGFVGTGGRGVFTPFGEFLANFVGMRAFDFFKDRERLAGESDSLVTLTQLVQRLGHAVVGLAHPAAVSDLVRDLETLLVILNGLLGVPQVEVDESKVP